MSECLKKQNFRRSEFVPRPKHYNNKKKGEQLLGSKAFKMIPEYRNYDENCNALVGLE